MASARADEEVARVAREHDRRARGVNPLRTELDGRFADAIPRLLQILGQILGQRRLRRRPAIVLDALHVPVESQMLVMSKTGVQGLHTGPSNPRAIYFTDSITIGYIHGAPLLEFAVHDPLQGVIFYTLDQKPQSQRSQSNAHSGASLEFRSQTFGSGRLKAG